MTKAILASILFVLGAVALPAQALSTTSIQVNYDAPAQATFIFNAIPGPTKLIIQCDTNQAWIVLYGEYPISEPFRVACSGPGSDLSKPTYSIAPITSSVTLRKWDGTTKLTITILSATWESLRGSCCRYEGACYKYGTGAAMIRLSIN
jgi:hypothetical protein